MARKSKSKPKAASPRIDPAWAYLRRPGGSKGIPLWFANPREVEAVMEKSVDRYMQRWARTLLLVTEDGEVRKLTEQEVEEMVGKTRSRQRPLRRLKKHLGPR